MSDVDAMFDRIVNPWMKSNIKDMAPNFDQLAQEIKSCADMCKHAAWNEVGRHFMREGRENLGIQCLVEALRHYPGNDSAAWTGIKLPPENPEARRIGEQLKQLPRRPIEHDQAENAILVADIQRIVGKPGKVPEVSPQVSPSSESSIASQGGVQVAASATLSASIGIETKGGVFIPLIDAGCKIPCERQEIFSTASENQSEIEIHVLEGVSPSAAENRSLGRFKITHLPKEPRGMPQIEVTFRVDPNLGFHVTARVLNSDTDVSVIRIGAHENAPKVTTAQNV